MAVGERFVWIGPVQHVGGYGEVARGYLAGLLRLGVDVVAVDSHGPVGAPDAQALAELAPLLRGPVRERERTCVYHVAPNELARLREAFPMPHAARRVACTISETDRLPENWVQALAPFDEVWVPATFHREVFALSGVPRQKLRVIPYGVDTARWSAAPTEPRRAPECFRFLYCFQLGWRKGFDLLLEAYLSEFRRDEAVELVLKLLPAGPGGPTRSDLVTSIASRVDFLRDDLPRVRVITDELGFDAMRDLYRSADLYISTDRANGWGMPCHEAMACGTAAATIDWSGSTEFMHEGNALLIEPGPLVDVDPRLVACHPDYAGQRWPAVPVEAVRRVLRQAFGEREALPGLAALGAREIRERFDVEHAARAILERDAAGLRSRPGLLAKLLTGLGLRAPESLLEGARGRVFVCPFDPARDDWREPLARYLERFDRRDDTTLCLWADTDSEAELEPLAREVTAVLEATAARGEPADVQLTVASSDHVPWERVELCDELLPPGSRFAAPEAIEGSATT